jgi:diphthamide biosynthesis methyltransferase
MSLSQAAEVIAAMAIQLVHDPPPHLTEDESARMVFRRTAIDTRLTNPVDDWSVVSCSNVGTKNQRFKFGSIKAVCSGEENGLHCLILPAELQALEQDALNRWS